MKCDKRLLEIKGTIVTIIRPNNDEVINPLKHIRFDEADLLNMMEYSHMTDRHRWKMLVSDKLKGYNFKYHGKIRFFRYDTGMANSSSDDFSYIQSGFPFALNSLEEANIKSELYNIIKRNKFRKEDSKDSIPAYILDNTILRAVSKDILVVRKRNLANE